MSSDNIMLYTRCTGPSTIRFKQIRSEKKRKKRKEKKRMFISHCLYHEKWRIRQRQANGWSSCGNRDFLQAVREPNEQNCPKIIFIQIGLLTRDWVSRFKLHASVYNTSTRSIYFEVRIHALWDFSHQILYHGWLVNKPMALTHTAETIDCIQAL